MKKRSLFERLSGSASADEYDAFDEDLSGQASFPRETALGARANGRRMPAAAAAVDPYAAEVEEEFAGEGQLPVDVYQTPNEVVIRAFVAGVRPDELNVSINRDMVTLEGSREERTDVVESDYFSRELFWGSFSRTVMLPQEVDVENSTATSKDGLLTIILPKLDKARQTKLRVKMG